MGGRSESSDDSDFAEFDETTFCGEDDYDTAIEFEAEDEVHDVQRSNRSNIGVHQYGMVKLPDWLLPSKMNLVRTKNQCEANGVMPSALL